MAYARRDWLSEFWSKEQKWATVSLDGTSDGLSSEHGMARVSSLRPPLELCRGSPKGRSNLQALG